MARANYCEFFRFDDRYCDVFAEDDHYLYVCAEPHNWPYLLACNEWHAARNSSGQTEWTRHDTSGADAAYLETLEYAPVTIAREIIQREYTRALYYQTRGDSCAWYGYDEPPTWNECAESARDYAGMLVDSYKTLETLELIATHYGYTPEYVASVYRECIEDGDDERKAYEYVRDCMQEFDL